MPALLILPLDMVDTSGETPSHAQEHEDRLVALIGTPFRGLAQRRLKLFEQSCNRRPAARDRAVQLVG